MLSPTTTSRFARTGEPMRAAGGDAAKPLRLLPAASQSPGALNNSVQCPDACGAIESQAGQDGNHLLEGRMT